ncbi:hypothetical protein [Alteromonas facilis]|uniref:hypothetical protein n=1 Tax=Alteromonas facilis TaxID=2048004 RepID=UPI000C29088E|nr:hypothetical protein [Alteromonas facilis]
MKTITIDDELYAYIAAQTKYIGEDASDILRRLLLPDTETAPQSVVDASEEPQPTASTDNAVSAESNVDVVAKPAETENGAVFVPEATALAGCSTVVERFLQLLSGLHRHHAATFESVLSIRGKGRDYFATSKEQLLATGSSTNPKAIPESQFWVVTNNNTGKKAAILRQVAEVLNYTPSQQDVIVDALTQ